MESDALRSVASSFLVWRLCLNHGHSLALQRLALKFGPLDVISSENVAVAVKSMSTAMKHWPIPQSKALHRIDILQMWTSMPIRCLKLLTGGHCGRPRPSCHCSWRVKALLLVLFLRTQTSLNAVSSHFLEWPKDTTRV